MSDHHDNSPRQTSGLGGMIRLLRLGIGNFVQAVIVGRLASDLVHYPPRSWKVENKPRSLILRHLDCGSCGGCELALLRANNPVWDLPRYNIKFESSPRHAHALAMTGPYVRNSQLPAMRTLEAMPIRAVVAIGDCAVDGGVFNKFYALAPRPQELEDATLVRIPGCPPTPEEIRTGLLQLAHKVTKSISGTA